MKNRSYLENPCSCKVCYNGIVGTETSTIHSKYIPIYLANSPQILNIEDRIFIYSIPDFYSSHYSTKSFSTERVKECFRGANNSFFTRIQNPKKEIDIFVHKGAIFDRYGNILLVLVSKFTGYSRNQFEPENDHLFLSYNMYDPKYKTLYKTVFENFILPALESGVKTEVMSSDEIRRTVFKPIIRDINSFKSIEEYNFYMSVELFKEWNTEEKLIEEDDDIIEGVGCPF